ncbi:hypothetical protein D7V80_20125 [Corallococcus sp. CA054B]|uniref:hypothetical protein n=1 Tax=Corallococcus sp. CA054B TaxID=2316734 RepID=UPI000EA20A2A|nr:hypothetical protein [Corallococcus sp. CA054B]RKG66348.1 hypothetical protein D7V80_20125 [Corallococcus sp. CA054B]
MLAAELHGKLGDGTNARDRMEDVLTSSVFGLLRCMESPDLLVTWLGESRSAVDGAGRLVTGAVHSADIHLWPRLRTRELDVLVLLRGPLGLHVIGIECKYASGKSNASVDDTGDDEQHTAGSSDQLAYYMDALAADALQSRPYRPEEVRRRSLLYLTAHAAMPREDLEASWKARREHSAIDLHWLPWRELAPLLPQDSQTHCLPRLLAELRQVLERRGLATFTGWKDTAPQWRRPSREPFFQFTRKRSFLAGMTAPTLPTSKTFWHSPPHRGA